MSGVRVVTGHSTAAGHMTVLNIEADTGLTTEQLAQLIDEALKVRYGEA